MWFKWFCCRSSCWSGSPSRCCWGWPRCGPGAITGRQVSIKDIALRQPKWPTRVTQISNCFSNQFEIPVLFYMLIALALPLRKADLVIVLLSWVFVVTRFVHAGIFVDIQRCAAARAGLVRRRAGVVGDVALLRFEDALVERLSPKILRKDSMTPAARLSAAIELIGTHRHRPRSRGEGAEGVGHRASLCRLRRPRRDRGPGLGRAAPPRFQCLDHGRRYAAGARAGHAEARAQLDAEAIAALCDGGRFAPEPLTEAERSALTSRSLE